MDSNQDNACNRLQVLDDSVADSDKSGCAVFAGGINVEKNILTHDLCCDFIKTDMLKVFNSISVQNDIKIEGHIIPIGICNKSSLGTCDNKWNKLYCIESHLQNLNSINANIKNLKIDNLRLSCCNINLNNSDQDTSYQIKLEANILLINLNQKDNVIINLIIDNPDIKLEYHKIILNQNNNINIFWNIHGNSYFS